MTIVFEKPANAAATDTLITAIIATTITATILYFGVFFDDPPRIIRLGIGFIASICTLASLFFFVLSFTYWKRNRNWRVEISQDTLLWSSPISIAQASFSVKLKEISNLRRRRIKEQGSEIDFYFEYFIDFHDGTAKRINTGSDRIDPGEVFIALSSLGIAYEKVLVQSRSGVESDPIEDPYC